MAVMRLGVAFVWGLGLLALALLLAWGLVEYRRLLDVRWAARPQGAAKARARVPDWVYLEDEERWLPPPL